ncbi:polysaccharide lyase family 7 protein [Streptomyces sp. NPDC021212]|uniref:polysaccharide lyase family 7 protein n=1 Tax=Streptomyces sp. NPDC021212 TaxID=3365118 RepID=UPI00378D43CD
MPALRMRVRVGVAVGALMAALTGTATAHGATATAAADPTDGWTRKSYTYSMHKPYNLDLSERYSYNSGTKTHTMWVNATDKPFEEGSSTNPRTEMRWKNDYTSGKHMWDADVYVPSGTNGADIMQILRTRRPSGTPATDIMFRASSANGGTLKRYTNEVIKTGIYDTWWNLKVAHDASAGTIKVYADNKLVLTTEDRGEATRYFKNGVYHHGSGRAEARFRNVRYWTQ